MLRESSAFLPASIAKKYGYVQNCVSPGEASFFLRFLRDKSASLPARNAERPHRRAMNRPR